MVFPWIAAAVIGSTLLTANNQRKAANAQAEAQRQQGELENIAAEYNATSTENVAKYNLDVLEQTAQRNLDVLQAQTDYQQKVFARNAEIYDRAAADSISRGVDSAADERLIAKRATGRSRAVAGSSGTVVGAGTNLDLQIQNAANGEMNALTVLNNAQREAYGFKVQAEDVREQARGAVYDSAIQKQNIRYQTDLEKQGVKFESDVDAANTRLRGKLGLISANNSAKVTKAAGRLEAMNTIISGGSKLAMHYSR